MGHLHNGGDDGTTVGTAGQVADEGLVDLQLVHRQVAQVGEAGVTGAEVVNRQLHAHRLQAFEGGLGLLGVVDQA